MSTPPPVVHRFPRRPTLAPLRAPLRAPRRAPLAAGLALLCTGALGTEVSDRGEALYANHCGECHAATLHGREHRRVDSREELRGWVTAWSTHTGLDWRDEDIESVTSYLSRRVYGFTR